MLTVGLRITALLGEYTVRGLAALARTTVLGNHVLGPAQNKSSYKRLKLKIHTSLEIVQTCCRLGIAI